MYRLTLWISLTILVPLSFSIPSTQQIPLQETNRSPFTPEFNEQVNHLLDRWHVPGLSVAIVDGNETFSKV